MVTFYFIWIIRFRIQLKRKRYPIQIQKIPISKKFPYPAGLNSNIRILYTTALRLPSMRNTSLERNVLAGCIERKVLHFARAEQQNRKPVKMVDYGSRKDSKATWV